MILRNMLQTKINEIVINIKQQIKRIKKLISVILIIKLVNYIIERKNKQKNYETKMRVCKTQIFK